MFDVSVVIPNYNGAAFLTEAIDSALNQEGVKLEVIVVDDGSTDESKAILKAYGSYIQVFFQENKGAPTARNLGWKHAKARYIKFLDSDDVLLPGILKLQIDLFQTLNEYEIPYGQALWVDENLQSIKGYPVKPKQADENSILHILTQNPLTSSPMHKKELLELVNGFDENLVKGQEFDLHLRLVLKGISLRYFNHDVYYFRQHSSITRFSNNPLSGKSEALYTMLQKQQVYIHNFYKGYIPNNIKKILAQRSWNFGRAILAEGNFKKATRFFENARTLSNHHMDERFLYKLTAILVGPIRAELILNRIKNIH